jgi:hypothetical protein
VQQEDGRLHVRVIPETENLKLLAERIEASLGRLDAKLPVDIEFVDAFPVEPSGKFCAIYSKQHPPIKTSLD